MRDHNDILNMLVNQDEISWQSIIYELVKSEKMNIWDIDVSVLAEKYIEILRTMKKHDFRISGKVILAAAILLKIQSTKLVSDELTEFDRLIAGDFASEQEFYDSLGMDGAGASDQIVYDAEIPELLPRTPQPRNRKVSVYDLVKALQKALEVKRRRIFHHAPPEIDIPERTRDITLIIRDVYGRIVDYFTTNAELVKNPLMFSQLFGRAPSRKDVIYTILPLLHLSCEKRIGLYQHSQFGDIEILYPGTKRMEEIKEAQESAYKKWLANELEQEKKHGERLKKLHETLKKKKQEKELEEKSLEEKELKEKELEEKELKEKSLEEKELGQNEAKTPGTDTTDTYEEL